MIGDLVAKLIAAGTQPELAASVVAEAFAAGVSTRQSGGSRVDEAAERRRAWDRDRKRDQRHLRLPVSEWYPLVDKILARDGHHCHYCGATDKLTADHVVPMMRGGTHDPENLVACCIPCNTKKGNKLLAEWLPKSADVHPTSADIESALTLTSLSTSLEHSEEKKELKKVRARKPNSAPLSADWQPNGKHFEAAEKLKIPNAAVLEKAEDMRLWARSTGAMKVDWDATFHGFLRRDAEKLAAYPTQKPDGVLSDDERARLFAKLREKPNGQENPRQGSELRAISDGARQAEAHRPKDSSDPSDDQSGHGGMGRLDPVFRRPSGVRASGDEAGEVGDGPGIYSPGQTARIV